MSKIIDSRVVDMQFNNSQFERNVSTSMSTLEKLKKSLNLSGATKGLEDINTAARGINMTGLIEAANTVRSRFSAMEIVAITALANITNSAINAGKQLVKSLTMDQVTAGWTKYEQKTASVQTIMNATGASIDEVNGYLDRLMWFSDETSYGFTDMTAALSQMTSSGGKIENLIPLITGVANATAYAGKGADEFSRSMYNLNQSYGSGNLQYMDWRSLELAGVASKELKQIFIDTGVAMGKIKEGTVDIGNFGTTLKDKWADTAVMEAAFGKFSELSEEAYKLVKSGKYDTAAQAMEELAGKYSEVAEKAFKSAQQAKTFTEAIDATKDAVSTGWMRTMEIIFGNLEEATVLWTDVTNALWDVFASSADARNDMLGDWKSLGGRDLLINSFAKAFETLGEAIIPVKEAFREFFPEKTGYDLYAMTKALNDFVESIKISDDTTDKLKRTFKGLFAVLDVVNKAFKEITKVVKPIFGPMISGLLTVTSTVGDLLVSFNEAIGEGEIFKNAFEKIRDVFVIFSEKTADAIERIKNAIGGFKNIDTGPVDMFLDNTEKRFKPFTSIAQIFSIVFETMVKVFEWAAPIVSKLGGVIGQALGAIADKISSSVANMDYHSLLDIVNTGLLGYLLVSLRKFVDSLTGITTEAGGFLSGIKSILDGVRDSLEAYQSNLKAKTLMTIATAIGILAISLVAISLINSGKLLTSLGGIAVLLYELTIATGALGKIMGNRKMVKTATTMVIMSFAILILSRAMKNLSSTDWNGVAKGAVSIFILSNILTTVADKLSKDSGKFIKGSVGLIGFSIAIMLLAHAMKSLASLSWEQLAKGMIGITTIIGEIIWMTRSMGYDEMTSASLSMIGFGIAINLFASAITKLGKIPLENMIKGLSAMVVIFTAITVSFSYLPLDMAGVSTTLIAMGVAMLLLAKAIENMGGMYWTEIAKGLAALGGSLLILTLAMEYMPSGIAGAGALMVMALAIGMLVPSLKILGSMDLSEIGVALLTLVGIFAIIGGASVLLDSLVPVMLFLAGTIALLGIAVVAIGGGLLLFSAAMTALAISGAAGGAVLVGIFSSLIGLIPYAIETLGEGLIRLIEVIGEGVPRIAKAFSKILTSFLDTVIWWVPQVIEAGKDFILVFIDGIVSMIPELIQRGFDLILAFINGLADAIRGNTDAMISAINNLMNAVTEAGRKALEAAVPAFKSAGVNVVRGFVQGIKDKIGDVISASTNVGQSALNAFRGVLKERSPSKEFEKSGRNANLGFANGLIKFAGVVSTSAKAVGKGALSAINDSMSNLADIISGEVDLNPTIRPVLDLSGISSDLSSLFGERRTLNLSEAQNRTSKITSSRPNKNDSQSVINQNFEINVTGNHIANDYDVDRITEKISSRLAREQRRSK